MKIIPPKDKKTTVQERTVAKFGKNNPTGLQAHSEEDGKGSNRFQ